MKNLIPKIILALLISVNIQAQTAHLDSSPVFVSSHLANYPDPFSEVTLFEFTTVDNSIVKLYLKDGKNNMLETLIEGEIEKGEHSVYFKAPENMMSGIYFCILEIYNIDNNELLVSEEKQIKFIRDDVISLKK